MFSKETNKINDIEWFHGNYRGKVVDNDGKKGKVKIFVPGIYPSEFEGNPDALPWAEPAYPVFGGNDGAATINSVPHKGTIVWLFFEGGDWNFPIYFATTEGGKSWKTAHKDQHIISTDHVKITIDENLDEKNDKKQTSQKYTKKCTFLARELIPKDLPTRVKITVDGQEGIGIDLVVNGHVNMKVNGDFIEHIKGSKYTTIEGNHYCKIKGHHDKVISGSENHHVEGAKLEMTDSPKIVVYNDDHTEIFMGNYTIDCKKDLTLESRGILTEKCKSKNFLCEQTLEEKIEGCRNTNILGDDILQIGANKYESVFLMSTESVNMIKSTFIGLMEETLNYGLELKEVIGAQTTLIGGAQFNTIGGIQFNTIGGSQFNTIGAAQFNTIGGAQTNTVVGVLSQITDASIIIQTPSYLLNADNGNITGAKLSLTSATMSISPTTATTTLFAVGVQSGSGTAIIKAPPA